MVNESLFNLYDEMLRYIRIRMLIESEKEIDGTVVLTDLNPFDKNHLVIAKIGLMLRDLENVPVKTNTSWIKSKYLNYLIRKDYNKIENCKKFNGSVIIVPDFATELNDIGRSLIAKDFELKDIYNAYFKTKRKDNQ